MCYEQTINSPRWEVKDVVMIEIQAKGQAIAQVQASDQSRSIPYRPEYNLITGRVTATILLQQINYWWYTMKRRPFYKFREPCEHEKYNDGDSWTEELGMTIYEFDGALKTIGAKVTKGCSKTKLSDTNLVIYWTDSNRVTWYQLNESLFNIAVYYANYEPAMLVSNTLLELAAKLEKAAF